MTVKELVERLKELDEDANVVVHTVSRCGFNNLEAEDIEIAGSHRFVIFDGDEVSEGDIVIIAY